jgi:DNA polymerase-3 subunit gamma/tau
VVIQGRELTQFVNDFVWYLRNLMLVQASDQMEDVVDMSTDNLKVLKEQADKADTDSILRFIRIFSELSTNIRYAAQKRILIEITLIRLCKPQMDHGQQDSLEDRLRILEEHDENNSKVISGIQSGQIAVAAAPMGGQQAAFSAAPAQKKVLDRAVPEDIKKLVSGWPKALLRMPNPMKTYMQKAKLSLGNNDKLQIVFDNRQLADKYSHGEGADELCAFIDDMVGKHVEYEARFLEPTQNFEENYVNLLQGINFDVVTEDDEDEKENL